MIKLFAIILLPILFIAGARGNETDSLKNVLISEKNDSIRITIMLDIGKQYDYVNLDTALFYYEDALKLAKKIKSDYLMGLSKTKVSIIWSYKGDYKKSCDIYLEAAGDFKRAGNELGVANCYTNIGVNQLYLGDYTAAIEYYMKAISTFDKLKDSKDEQTALKAITGQGGIYTNMGIIHLNMMNLDEAKSYFVKAIELYRGLIKCGQEKFIQAGKIGIASCYSNLGGLAYKMATNETDSVKAKEQFLEARKYYEKSIEIELELGNSYNANEALANLGIIHRHLGDFNKAIECYEQSLKVSEGLGEVQSEALIMGNIAALYIEMKKYDEALVYAEKSLKIAKEINLMNTQMYQYLNLSRAYEGKRDFNRALENHKKFVEIKDSLYTSEKNKYIQELDTKYQSEKKQIEIEKLESEQLLKEEIIERKDSENRKQRIIIITSIAGFFVVVIFAILLFRLFLQKKKANLMLKIRNEEILQQKEEIKTINDQLTDAFDTLKAKNKEITDSIYYAKRIQSAVIPESDKMKELLGDYFVFFKPRDIVSGDFYWVSEIENRIVIAVADCTGHGVPGAFMSMLGTAFLNEIVNKEYITNPAIILRRLRKSIIRALKQKSGEDEVREFLTSEESVKDGMDIALCSIGKENGDLQFAGANNPVYIIRNMDLPEVPEAIKTEGGNKRLYELKGDKMPIAIYVTMDKFREISVRLEKGDRIYMFSDGFADQFGGEYGKKFMNRSFKKMLLESSDMEMKLQKVFIEKTFNEWIGNYSQIDDICILGTEI